MHKIQFSPNIPVSLHLVSTEGILCDSAYGNQQVKFQAKEGPFWVSEGAGAILADQIRKKRIQPGQSVAICRKQEGAGRAVVWQIEPLEAPCGPQPDGTFALPAPPSDLERKLQASIDQVEARKANGHNGHQPVSPLTHSGWAGGLRDQTQALIDVYADCLKYSSRHEGLVKAEDVRSILLSAFIGLAKGGGK